MRDALRDWVLLPITLVMVLVGVFRNNVLQLLEARPKPAPVDTLRQRNILARATALRRNYMALPPSAVALRRAFLTRVLGDGSYLDADSRVALERERNRKQDELPEMPKNPFTDPGTVESMLDQAKKSMVMMVPQTLIMGWVNLFFTGFVLIKLPFPLTQRFKVMLQRDIDTSDLDVAWVSSLSWYFLNLYGLDAIYRILLGNNNAADSSRDMAAMGGAAAAALGPPAGLPGPVTDYAKLHEAERDSLALITSSEMRWVGDGVEERVLSMYG
ncbi:hypothetical protein MSPP1_003694 [Malassezia sp. CBS 17886]|nr:hypothetical protein MSPP1_003694 [Malassezia sp. CBS 17886]